MQYVSYIHSKPVVNTKFRMSIIVVLIGFSLYGQSNYKNLIKDSTKIEIIGESVYRVHQEIYVKKDSGWARSDSTQIRYSKITLSNVLFKRSKTEILSESLIELDNVFTLMNNNLKTSLQINGYSDKIGDSKSNLELSQIRARIIKINLTERGIKANRIATYGYGDKFPLCPSPCEKNQRVEFIMLQ